jgi:hypothetical protein
MGVEEIVSWLGQRHLARHGGLFATDCSAGGGRERKMPRSKRTLSLLSLAAFVALTLAAAPSFAVVGGITDLTEFSDPASQYYGMNWSYVYKPYNGSSVAIGYFTLLTADHYLNNKVGDTFWINGDNWRVSSVETPNEDYQPTPDLRVLHLENLTNQYRPLPGFYDLYTGTFSTASSFVIVGLGNTGVTYDTYYTNTSGTSGVRRWGTNRFDKLVWKEYTTHNTRCFKMRYSKIDDANTVHESGVGSGDSGGGVFVKDGDTWKLAGINLYRDYYPGSTDWYRDFYAASIPYYASKLYDILQYDLLPGDADLDGNVDSYDYITLKANFGRTEATWSQGDFNSDGLVGYEDFIALTTNFGYKSTPHPIMTPPSDGYISTGSMAMPEPGSAILLVLGAAALLRRRQGYGGQVRRRGGESKRRNQ